ncbi:MAG: hypothetical protein EBX50_14820 [Chitinophagia bacterium]|nr:hypothetical protein [Chitinophagia bacterium]
MLNTLKQYLLGKKVILKVLSSSFLSLPVNLLVSVITLRYIDPYYLGVWAAMTIFETYANILRLGIVNGMNRELPYALGTGEQEKAIGYAQTTFAFNLFATVIIWIIAPLIMFNFELNSTYIAPDAGSVHPQGHIGRYAHAIDHVQRIFRANGIAGRACHPTQVSADPRRGSRRSIQ